MFGCILGSLSLLRQSSKQLRTWASWEADIVGSRSKCSALFKKLNSASSLHSFFKEFHMLECRWPLSERKEKEVVEVEIEMREIQDRERRNYIHESLFASKWAKSVLQFFFFFLVFKFKNRGEKDTFEAHGKSSKAEPLGNSSCERKVQGPSACHQCPLKALGGAGGRWHPGAVYFMVSLKMSERGPWGPHFITQPSAALQSAGFWPPGGGRPVNNCGCSVPCLVFWVLQ